MCGIAGYDFGHDQAPHDLAARMLAALRHRGPDGEGALHVARTPDGPRLVDDATACIALLHTRLAIIDLSLSGHEPMGNEDGTLWLTFNGEIYNYRPLRQQLLARGHRFHSSSDAEVIVHGAEEWGDDVVTHLRGMFAFALYDLRRDRWLCARDPFGIKPLAYWHQGGQFAFASELGALRALPGLDQRLDGQALAQYLALGYVPSPLTIVQGARKLPRGHTLVVERGQAELRPYQRHAARAPIVDVTAAIDATLAALRESVAAHLVADVPVGCLLSGGVDSSLITALACDAGATPDCFTMGFDTARFDERPFAAGVARALRVSQHTAVTGAAEASQTLLELPSLYDEPFADASAVPTVLLARLARRHVKTVLSGDGGDELFLGYTRYRLFAYADAASRLPKPARRLGVALARRLPAQRVDELYDLARRYTGLPGLAHPSRKLQAVATLLASDSRLALYAATLRAASQETLERLLPHSEALALEPLHRAARSATAQPAQLFASHIDEATWLPDDILVKVDRATMAVGLEARVPIVDVEVAALARAIAPALHCADGGKAVLRRALDRKVARELTHRPKQGFSIPLAAWLRGPLHGEVSQCTHSAALRHAGLELGGVQQLAEEHQGGKLDHGHALWALIALRRYLECHG